MPLYDVTDTDSGMTLTLEGDSPPNEQELEEIFRQLKPAQPPEPEKPKPGPIELAARARGAVAPMTEEARAAGEKPLVEDLVPWQVNAAASLGVPGAKTVQAVTRGLTKPIAAMTSPTGAALTAATIAMPQIGIPLGIGMGAVGIPSAYQKTREGISEGNLEKTIEGLTEGGLSTGMLVGGVAGIGGLLARKPVLPMTSREAGIPPGEPTLEPISLPETLQPVQTALVAMPPKLAAIEQAKRRAAIKEARPMGVPETPPEAQRGISVIDEIRQAGADTKEKVRALFPQISREEAGRLRDLAFPREKALDNLSKADVERLFLEPEQARTEAELAEAKPVAEETPKAPLTQDELVGQKLGGITHLVPIITRLSKVYREQGPEAGRGYLEMMAAEAPESSGFKQEVETPGFIDSLDNRIRSELGLEQAPKVEAQPAVPEPPKEPAPPTVTPAEQAELRADLAAEIGEKPTSEIKGINWDAYYENLVGDLDAFAPARTSGRRSYEMDDVADRFVTFVRKDKTGRTPIDLVNEFAQQDKATTTQIRKLRASVKNLEKTTQPTPVEPPKTEAAPTLTLQQLKETLPDKLRELLTTTEGEYALQNIYESNVGERAPRNSGQLLSFLIEHYEKYPQDIEKDLMPLVRSKSAPIKTEAAPEAPPAPATEAGEAAGNVNPVTAGKTTRTGLSSEDERGISDTGIQVGGQVASEITPSRQPGSIPAEAGATGQGRVSPDPIALGRQPSAEGNPQGPPRNLQDLKSQFVQANEGRVSAEQVDALGSLVESVAAYKGVTPDEYVRNRFSGIVSGGEPQADALWKWSDKNPEEVGKIKDYLSKARLGKDFDDYVEQAVRYIDDIAKRDVGSSAVRTNIKTLLAVDISGNCPLRESGTPCLFCYVEIPRTMKEIGIPRPLSPNKIFDAAAFDPRDITEMPDHLVQFMNDKLGGLRVFSTGDYKAADVATLDRIVKAARERGLRLKIITKQPEALARYRLEKHVAFNLSSELDPRNSDVISETAFQRMIDDGIDPVTARRSAEKLKTLLSDNAARKLVAAGWEIDAARKAIANNPRAVVRYVAMNRADAIRAIADHRVGVVTMYHGVTDPEIMMQIWDRQNPYLREQLGPETYRALASIFKAPKVPKFSGTVTAAELKSVLGDRLISVDQFEQLAVRKFCCQTGRCSNCVVGCGFTKGEGIRVLGKMLDGEPLASIEFDQANRALIRAFSKSNVAAMAHELGHVFRRDLSDQDLAAIERDFGIKDGKWLREHEEKWANGFERYLKDGKAPTSTLAKVFAQFKEWLTAIYQRIRGSSIDAEISSEMKRVMDKMLSSDSSKPVSPGPGAAGAGEMKDLGAATPASIPSAPSNFRHWYDVHIGRPGAKLAPTVKRLWNTGSVRHAIATLKDWSENSARLFSRSQANDIRQPLRRFAKKDFKVADNALSMVVEAKGSYAALQEMRLKLTSSTQADPWWRKQALDALDYATYHWDELSKLAKDYKDITKAQVGIENASDIPTLEREGYVPHRQEIEELDLLTKTGQGGSTFFEKPRVYETFADSIAAGVDPKTLSATDLLEHRLNSGMRLVNSRKWMDSLRQLKDPETKAPIATNLKPLVRADGSKVMVPPAGYVAEMIGPHSVAILKGYEGIFSALTDPSFFTKSMAGRAFLTANATGKSLRLLFDTFHLGRVAFWLSLIKSLGVRTFKAPFPTYRRGVTLLDFTTNQIQEMAKAGEIPQRWLNNLLEDKRRLDLAVKSGYNVGRISDALYQDLIHSIPGLGTFNKWLFDQFQRGAMSEAWLLEFERAKRASPGYSEAELAKQVSYALNVRFGNLGRQGWFKSRSFQDIARSLALAPQWNEGLIKSEWGAVREAGQFILDAAAGRRIYAGILMRSVGAMALMQFIANQVLNQATRGKFTWENPEEGWGAKISAWIPDVTGNGPGFFLHPLGLAAETVHLLTNLYERSGGDTAKTVTDYFRSRSSAVMQPTLALITRSDFLGRKMKPGTVWWEVAKTAIPVPIAGGALFAAGKQIVTGQPSEQFAGQYQKQAMASLGVRTESAPSPGQRIARLAADWRREKGIPSNEAFYGTGDYQPLVQALRIGNSVTAKQEIVKLRKTHTDAEIRQHFSRWQRAPFTGSHAREREFRRQLTPKQEIAYIKARNERARVSAELRKLLR